MKLSVICLWFVMTLFLMVIGWLGANYCHERYRSAEGLFVLLMAEGFAWSFILFLMWIGVYVDQRKENQS